MGKLDVNFRICETLPLEHRVSDFQDPSIIFLIFVVSQSLPTLSLF